MSTQNNPLASYFRTAKNYIDLPSGCKFYDDTVIKQEDHGEIAILPMTTQDELLFKTPDALLNGEAIRKIITSCVPQVLDPTKLLINDVDALLLAIKHASYGDNLTLNAVCPKCSKENTYNMSIDQSISQAEKLDDVYVVNLENGLSVFVQPYTLATNNKATRTTFEENKVLKSLNNPALSEEEKLHSVSNAVKKLSELNFDLITECITVIKGKNNDGEFSVTDKENIKEFIFNIHRHDAKEINDKIAEINRIGIKKKYKVVCDNEECKHEWDVDLDIDPSSFFTES